MGKFIDLNGKIFGKWTVLSFGERDSYEGKIRWKCKCSCGDIHLVMGLSLRNGRSKGCVKCCTQNKTHGHSQTPTYKVWDSMIQRCTNPKCNVFTDYGGRGIKVCQEWRDSFVNFLKDMGLKPPRLTLDRIDNNAGYSRDNCRWTTMVIQNRNRRTSAKIGESYNGWTLLKRFNNPSKSKWRCDNCANEIIYDTSHVKTGRKLCHCRHVPPPL